MITRHTYARKVHSENGISSDVTQLAEGFGIAIDQEIAYMCRRHVHDWADRAKKINFIEIEKRKSTITNS